MADNTPGEEKILYNRLIPENSSSSCEPTNGSVLTKPENADQGEQVWDILAAALIASYNQQANTSEEHPSYPFVRTAGILGERPTYAGQPYVNHILLALGEAHVPRRLQSNNRNCDLESGDTSSKLYGIIEKLKPRCNILTSEEARRVRREITKAVNEMLYRLRKMKSNTGVFNEATAVLLGSTAETTKVSHPDEWDFVIFLPYFWEKNKCSFPMKRDSRAIYLGTTYREEVRELELVLKKFQTETGDNERDLNVEEILKRIVTHCFKSVIEGTCLTFKSACYGHQTALALRLTYEKLEIKMDISFGFRDEGLAPAITGPMVVRSLEEKPTLSDDGLVPLIADPEILRPLHEQPTLRDEGLVPATTDPVLVRPLHEQPTLRDEDLVPAITDPVLVRSLEEQPTLGFYILRGSLMSPTSTFEEVRYMQRRSENIKLCFQLAKCLVEQLTPPYYKRCKCRESIVPSFRLKLILYYMCKYYDGERFWTEEQFTNRILEFFVVYSLCLKFGTVNNLLSMFPVKQYIDVGQYFFIGNPEPHPPHLVKSAFLPCDLEQSSHNLSAFIDDSSVIENFLSVFSNPPGCQRMKFDADIISAFCEMLRTLKQPSVCVRDLFTYTSKGSQNLEGVKEEKMAGTDNFNKRDLREQWVLTVEGEITSMVVAPNHEGELLLTTTDMVIGHRRSRLLKMKYNEVIQEIYLPARPYDMCYYNECISVGIQRDICTTYDYRNLSEVSSFKTAQFGSCRGLTRLDDGFVICMYSKEHILKTSSTGDTVCCSDTIFQCPLYVEGIIHGNAVAVCDENCVWGLSSDLQSVLFTFAPKRYFRPVDLVWNYDDSSILTCERDRISVITSDGTFIRELTSSYPDSRLLICHNTFNDFLYCHFWEDEYMSKVLVYQW